MSVNQSDESGKSPGLSIEVVVITPELAEVYLQQNTGNRPLSRKRMLRYSQEMTAGTFAGMNGDSIRFSKSGRLLDGQKRLAAIIHSGVPLKTLVMRNLEDDVFYKIDLAEARTSGQIHAIRGEKNHNVLAAALSVLWKYKNNRFTGDQGVRQTKSQELELLQANPGIRNSVSFAAGNKDLKRICGASIVAFCHYGFTTANRDSAELFFKMMCGELPITKKKPAFILRERLTDNRFSKAKLSSNEVVALWIKAFNSHLIDAEVKTLRWSSGANERFPQIIGYLPSDVR